MNIVAMNKAVAHARNIPPRNVRIQAAGEPLYSLADNCNLMATSGRVTDGYDQGRRGWRRE